jgi:hypothetical protein
MLVSANPELFHLPRYLWHRGWIGAWLDIDEVDWDAVDAVLVDAWRMTGASRPGEATAGGAVEGRRPETSGCPGRLGPVKLRDRRPGG